MNGLRSWRTAPSLVLASLAGRILGSDPYERLTNMAQQARADRRQFLEHLLLRAEAVWKFQPLVPPPPRPWWKLWGKDPEIELPAIVADLRNAA